jgi:AcrR family transcriptional regulator
VEGLTIRAVAAAVDCPPRSLYSHFANKEELLDLMYAEVALRLYADSAHDTWQAALAALCHQIRGVLLDHPRWLPLLSRPAFAIAVPLRERILELMSTAAFTPEDAVSSVTNAALMALGLTTVELTFREPGGASALARRFERLREMTSEAPAPEVHAVTQTAFARMRQLDMSQNFADCVSIFVRGLQARLTIA